MSEGRLKHLARFYSILDRLEKETATELLSRVTIMRDSQHLSHVQPDVYALALFRFMRFAGDSRLVHLPRILPLLCFGCSWT